MLLIFLKVTLQIVCLWLTTTNERGGVYPWVTVKSCQCFANGYVHYVDMVKKIAVILNEHVQQVEEYKTQII